MSDIAPVSAVSGATFEAADVSIREMGAVGMVTIRGDFGSKTFGAAVKDVTGCDLPDQRRVVSGDACGLCWMSPDELLVVCDYAEAQSIADRIGAALGEEHHLAQNVSDARAAFEIRGVGARELIAKGAPVDMSPEAFGAGDIRRTRVGQVAAAFWCVDGGAFRLVCFRSVGGNMFQWLSTLCASGARPHLF